MTIINPNSISGISSITALNSTAAINLFKADGTSANIIAGVTTGSNFITGTSNVHSTGYECTNINASGIVTAASLDISGDIDFDGHTELDNVRIAGVATFYQGGSEVVRINSGGLLAYNDISFFGASTHAYWDHSANQFLLTDNTKLSIGGSSDLQLYHDGSHSRIYNSTGNLSVRSAVFDVLNADGSERMLRGTADSGCELFFNGDLKLQTRSTDTVFYDDIRLGDNHKINVGTLDDMQLFHNGSHSYIDNLTGGLYLRPANNFHVQNRDTGEVYLKGIANGSVELYHDGSLKLSTGNNGINVSGSVSIVDGGRYYFGSANDAYLFHDGANTHFYNQTGHLQIRQAANSDVITQTNAIDRFRIYNDGVVAIGQSSKSSTVGAGNLDIQGNATSCIIEMGNPFPTFSGGVVPEFRITATNSSHEVKFESVWGGDNLLHKQLSFSAGITAFYKGTTSDEVARFNQDKFFIGQTTGSSRLCVSDTNPVIAELHHSDGGTNDEARLMLGALSANPPSNRGAGIAAVNNGNGHDLTIKCSASHAAGPSERLRIDSAGRCIVGGGTHAGGSALVVKGGNQNTYSTIGMFSNHTNPADNTLLTQIRFGSNTSAVGADIRATADAAWGTNDYPTRLSFYTTPDGSNSRSERLRITKDGQIRIDQATSANNGIRMRPSGWNYDFRMGAVSSSGGSIWLGQNYEPTGGTRDSASYGTNYIRFTTQGEIMLGTGATDTNPSERLRISSSGQIGLGGANYGTSGQVLTSQGSGSAATWTTITGTTINNNADNRLITGSGTANTLNGEANFTYNSTLAQLTTSTSTNNTELLRLQNSHTDGKMTVMGFNTDGLGYSQTRIYGGNDNTGAASQQGDSGAVNLKYQLQILQVHIKKLYTQRMMLILQVNS